MATSVILFMHLHFLVSRKDFVRFVFFIFSRSEFNASFSFLPSVFRVLFMLVRLRFGRCLSSHETERYLRIAGPFLGHKPHFLSLESTRHFANSGKSRFAKVREMCGFRKKPSCVVPERWTSPKRPISPINPTHPSVVISGVNFNFMDTFFLHSLTLSHVPLGYSVLLNAECLWMNRVD